MKKVTNTTKDEAHPEWCIGGNPNAIEAQESRGQNELIESTQLPVQVRGKKDGKADLEVLGVVFGATCSDDPLFCEATLPEGWIKRATDHSMWSELVDENGKVRANIFYKAAFYDRSAFMCVK